MKLSQSDIEEHYRNESLGDDVLFFQEPDHDEVIEEPYDPREDDWLFDDGYYDDTDDYYDDPYDDPYWHDDDYC